MPGFEVKVEGLDELKRQLDALARPLAKRISNRALRAGAEVYKAAVEEATPVRAEGPSGTALPPGALKHDIRVRAISAPDQDSSYVIVGPGKYTAHVMRWLEFGHRLVRGGYSKVLKNGKTRGPGKEVKFVPANPIMRSAFEGRQSEALEAITQSLREDLAKLPKGGV